MTLQTLTNSYRAVQAIWPLQKGKTHIKVHQVSRSETLSIRWPMKYWVKVSLKLFLLTYKLLQGSKICSDCKNNIVVQSTCDNNIFDCWIKTHYGLVASQVSLRNRPREGSVGKIIGSTTTESHQHSTCRARPYFKSDHSSHWYGCGTQSHRYIWALWWLYLGKGQREWCKKNGCWALQNIWRKAVLQHQLTFDSHFWRKEALTVSQHRQHWFCVLFFKRKVFILKSDIELN